MKNQDTHQEFENAEQYLAAMEAVVGRHFAPHALFDGRPGIFVLARMLGYGLKGFPPEETKKVYGSLYSRFVVKHQFGRAGGVLVDAKEFIDEVRAAEDYDRKYRKPLPESKKRME